MAEKTRTVGENELIAISRKIAAGSKSIIYRGRFDDRDVAVKKLHDREEELPNEVEILRDVDHINVVKYLFTDVDDDSVYIVMEMCNHTLRTVINDRVDVDISYKKILKQITQGLYYLHISKNLIHRDLKPSNILLILKDHVWLVKISDFGISKRLPGNRTSVTQTGVNGTVGYVASEILRNENVRKASDIFSLGAVFHYVLSKGKHPFGNDVLKIESKIRDGDTPDLDHLEDEYADDTKSLISSMLEHNHEDRVTVDQILAHHFFWKGDKKLIFIQEVSDYLEDRGKYQDLINRIEKPRKEIVGANWTQRFESSAVLMQSKSLKGMKDTKRDKVQELMRLIRNWKHHYNDKSVSDEFRKELSSLPDGFLCFFTSRFPKLLSHIYDIMKSQSEETQFQKFYRKTGMVRTDPVLHEKSYEGKLESMEIGEDSKHLHGNLTSACRGEDSQEPTQERMEIDDANIHVETEVDSNQKDLVLRKYQLELAKQAMAGHNSLIVSPTGSGKTAVAYAIMKEHLLNPSSKKILFFVSRTTLAEQQYLFFQRYLDCPITFITGGSGKADDGQAPDGMVILKNRLIVLTPQILINELKRTSPYISFNHISMMVFDECHHATKRHPYKVLLDMMLENQRETGKINSIQIVGLTASPGVGNSTSRENVRKNLLTLLAGLNISQHPVIVERNKDELEKYMRKMEKVYIRVPIHDDDFTKKVLEVMHSIEEKIKETVDHRELSIPSPPEQKSEQAYDNWTVDVRKIVETQDAKWSMDVIFCIKNLRVYHILLLLSSIIPNPIDVVDAKMDFQRIGVMRQFLLGKFEEVKSVRGRIKVPMFDKLLNVLREEFESNPRSRCMIFVTRKIVTFSLASRINQDENLQGLNARYLTSVHEGSHSGGMTESNQKESLKLFREGTCKVLIATSVAEEGLHIPACNLVITYNYVTGEVGSIQRQGRIRAKNGKSILITTVDSKHIKREEMNRAAAEASKVAIDDISTIPIGELQRQIFEIKEEQRKTRLLEKQRAMLTESKKVSPAGWKILCALCQKFITLADKLFLIQGQHIVVCDPSIETTLNRKPCTKKKGPVHGVAEYFCKTPECPQKLALGMIFKKKHYVTLSIKKTKLQNNAGEIFSAKTKMGLPFTLPILEDGDATAISSSKEFPPAHEVVPPVDSYPVDDSDALDEIMALLNI